MREIAVVGGAGQDPGREPEQTAVAVTAASEIADPILSRLYAYWDGKRGDRKCPLRCELDPVDIPRLLPNVFLVSVRSLPFDLVFRLAGTAITDCNGGNITGMRMLEMPSTVAGDLYRQSARAARSGCPVLVSGPARTRADAYRRVDHLILPLGSTPGVIDMLIGAAVFQSYRVGEGPERGSGRPGRGPHIRAVDRVRLEPARRLSGPGDPSGPASPGLPSDHKITSV